jgi:hypothetical protein
LDLTQAFASQTRPSHVSRLEAEIYKMPGKKSISSPQPVRSKEDLFATITPSRDVLGGSPTSSALHSGTKDYGKSRAKIPQSNYCQEGFGESLKSYASQPSKWLSELWKTSSTCGRKRSDESFACIGVQGDQKA